MRTNYKCKKYGRYIKLGILLVAYSLFVLCVLLARASKSSTDTPNVRHKRDTGLLAGEHTCTCNLSIYLMYIQLDIYFCT